ncbi:TonB-dependent receptor [Flammeovirga sp. OC4]|uniref:SusC/RagA family TonB-linked outer membrane protein n=1 Tax=Flammeovirga sp. OC4 TaxID=1382345 RepID=UPI0012E060EE|nr:TonB-dependent receptor [Flammeovirga sp. OC4]
MQRIKLLVSVLIVVLTTNTLFAQEVIKGIVKDEMGESLPGVNVLIKGTTYGSTTDFDGEFTLTVEEGAVLVFSYIGYQQKEITVGSLRFFDVSLEVSAEELEELVVIGYGTAKKSDLTSSISSVDAEDLQTNTTNNALQSLQGKAAGVQITNSTGNPGSAPSIIIRGMTTINGSNPLFVVDGMPVGDNINFLNQDDIASMEILKDASATAIYGTRGSNGVVLITTKKGKEGPMKFNFKATMGLQQMQKPQMAGAEEYEMVYKANRLNDGIQPGWNPLSDLSEGTDWWDEVVNDFAVTENYNLGFQGGAEKVQYSGSVSYYKQNSQFDAGYYDRITARFNTIYKVNEKVSFGVDFAPRVESWENSPNALQSAMTMDPTTPVYRPEEEWDDNPYNNYQRSYNSQVWNPAGVVSRAKDNNNSKAIGGLLNSYLTYDLAQGLQFKTQYGINGHYQQTNAFTPEFFIDNFEQSEISSIYRTSRLNYSWNWTNTVNYSKEFGKHSINALGGFTMEKFVSDWSQAGRTNVPSNDPNFHYVSAGIGDQFGSGNAEIATLVSFLGRFQYNYDSKYYLTASLRADGSSKFPTNQQFGVFPSVSASWRVSEEDFLKNSETLSNLKIRAGWGQVGNQSISNSAFLSLIGYADYTFNGERVPGTALKSVGNNNLRWETVEDFNLGVDVGFFDDRLTFVADIFRKTSHDMLMQKDNPLYLGYPNTNSRLWANIGSMQSQGFEFTVNWRETKGDLTYNIGLNLTQVESKALELVEGAPYLDGSLAGIPITRTEEGRPVSLFYGHRMDGIFQTWEEVYSYTNENGQLMQPNARPGDIRFVDLNGDGVIDGDDQTFIGNPAPKIMLGLNLGLEYKGFDITANFYGKFGHDVFNTTKFNYMSGTKDQNVWAGTYNSAWHGPGTSNTHPRLSMGDPNQNYNTISSFYVEDGSYLRLQLLQVGYTLPKKVTGDNRVRVSLSAQNLFTISNYSGLDPETASAGSATAYGIDYLSYPVPRTFLIGINANF